MISIITFKWKKSKQGYKLKNKVEYSSNHVNILYDSIKRNTTIPFKFFCITDDNTDLLPDINYVPLWDKYKYLGGCYNRLYVFSSEIKNLLGDKLFSIDLDCVITGNIDSILNKDDDFVINQYRIKNNSIKQLYNGGMFLLTTGARKQVWENFDPVISPNLLQPLRDKKLLQGSDQAWIQYALGNNEKVYTNEDGVYDYYQVGSNLPSNAKIVFFPGRDDPALEREKIKWIRDNWYATK